MLISGDFFVSPSSVIYDLEARLKDIRLDLHLVSGLVADFFASRRPILGGLEAEHVICAAKEGLSKLEFAEMGLNTEEISRLFPVNGSPRKILGCEVSLLLLPYCAKRLGCKYRAREDCMVGCGGCTVGQGFGLALSAGMKALTILNFEHLIEVLGRAPGEGIEAFIGCCCQAFFNKHRRDFLQAGLPGILVDIEQSTCFDLGKTREAYQGSFERQTRLDLRLLEKLLGMTSPRRRERVAADRAFLSCA